MTIFDQVRALALVLPSSAVFSHETASQLLKLPFKQGDGSIHVTMPPGSSRIRRPGVVAHRATIEATLATNAVRVSDGVSTWAALAGEYTVDDLVVLGDAIATREPSDCVRLAAATRERLRGVHRLREALPLIRVGARSPMETRARLVMMRAGLPEPQLNPDVRHPVTGEWLAQPDFVWPEQRVVAEYDSDRHRTDRAQWRADIVRKRLLEEAGWRVIVYTADDVLRHPYRLVDSLRIALGC